MSRAGIRPASKPRRPALIAEAKASAIRDRVARLRDRRIEQHGIIAEFHRQRRVRRGADPGIDDELHIREVGSEARQRRRIREPASAADRRAPRHDDLAPDALQALGDGKILGCIGKDLEAFSCESACRFDESEDIGLQRVVVADDFELDPVCAERVHAPSPPS